MNKYIIFFSLFSVNNINAFQIQVQAKSDPLEVFNKNIFAAIYGSYPDLVKQLLEIVDHRDDLKKILNTSYKNGTLLDLAIKTQNLEVVNLLLIYGAEIKLENTKNIGSIKIKRFIENFIKTKKILTTFVNNGKVANLINQYMLDKDKINIEHLDLRTDFDICFDSIFPCGCCCCFCWLLGAFCVRRENKKWFCDGCCWIIPNDCELKNNL